MKVFAIVICLFGMWEFAHGHGRMLEPPNRSSLWRFPSDPAIAPYVSLVEENYNDDGLYCGGFQYQQNLDGKCGVCGDAWDLDVKPNEAGGKYAKGIIVRQYTPGSWFTAEIEITAHHKGFFEFRLCPWNDPTVPITHECLNQHLLENSSPHSPRYMLSTSDGSSSQHYQINLKLPDGVECDQCVLQWRYHAGNTWNCDNSGNCCTGCGPQEEFYGCADIAIGYGPTQTPPFVISTGATTPSTTTTTKATTTKATTTAPSGGGGTNPCPNAPGNHKYDCDSFYNCAGDDMFVYDCPPGTVFDEAAKICDYPHNVPPPCGTKS